MFKIAEMLNGVDAWRRIVRHVDHGKAIYLETLRREKNEIHQRPIKSLEAVEEGVANFENVMQEYTKAGGPVAPDSELKSDLLRILPREIRELLLWHSSNVDVTFQRFRDTVVSQTAAVLMNRGGGRSVGHLDQETSHEKSGDDYLAAVNRLANCEDDDERERQLTDLLAAVGDRRGRDGRRPGPRERPARPTTPARRPGTPAAPRNCPNCGGSHVELRCPHPEVARDKRKCWTCQGTGHSSRDCPKKPPAKRVNVVEDEQPTMWIKMIESDQGAGYTPVRRGNRTRPVPKTATLGDFMSNNAFTELQSEASAGDVGLRR